MMYFEFRIGLHIVPSQIIVGLNLEIITVHGTIKKKNIKCITFFLNNQVIDMKFSPICFG